MRGGRRIEVVTVGLNPNLQLVGSDPAGTKNDIGLFIGANGGAIAPGLRQLFMLAQLELNHHQRAKLVGFRQLLTIGADIGVSASTTVTTAGTLPTGTIDVSSTTGFPTSGTVTIINVNGPQTVTYTGTTPTTLTGAAGGAGAIEPGDPVFLDGSSTTYPLETQVGSPWWKFTDGNVLWGIRRLVRPQLIGNAADGTFGGTPVKFRWSTTPAQLFEAIATGVITPPWGGLFPGEPLTADLGRMNDIRNAEWQKPTETDVWCEGPCNVAFFASIQQTNPATRLGSPPANVTPLTTINGATKEDSFVQAYNATPGSGGVTYKRIAGSLIFEMDDEWTGQIPKEFARPSDGDRLVVPGAQTGDPLIRRDSQDTSDFEPCGDGSPNNTGSSGSRRLK